MKKKCESSFVLLFLAIPAIKCWVCYDRGLLPLGSLNARCAANSVLQMPQYSCENVFDGKLHTKWIPNHVESKVFISFFTLMLGHKK